MNREETKKAIEVMQAYVDGAEIQVRDLQDKPWSDLHPPSPPAWRWSSFEYRVKPKEPRTFYAVDYKLERPNAENMGPLHDKRETAEMAAGHYNGVVIELVEVIR